MKMKIPHCDLNNSFAKCEYRKYINTNISGHGVIACILQDFKCTYQKWKEIPSYLDDD